MKAQYKTMIRSKLPLIIGVGVLILAITVAVVAAKTNNDTRQYAKETECTSENDCGSGYRCVSGTCVAKKKSTTGGGTRGADGTDNGVLNGRTREVRTTTTTTPTKPPTDTDTTTTSGAMTYCGAQGDNRCVCYETYCYYTDSNGAQQTITKTDMANYKVSLGSSSGYKLERKTKTKAPAVEQPDTMN